MNYNMWMVRAGKKSRLINDFLEHNIVGLGFEGLGDISEKNNLDIIKELLKKNYLDKKEQTINNWAGQIISLLNFNIGDYVITYDRNNRKYHIGKIESNYEYNEKICEYYHIRRVKWVGKVFRDQLSVSTKNALGAWQSIFNLKEPEQNEILSLLESKESLFEHIEESKEELEDIRENLLEESMENIKDMIVKLKWDEMQELIAGILRAMGYKTIISDAGSDRGKDIIASTDGLGLEEPRIKVEVKHRKETIRAPDIRNFAHILIKGNAGLYVSTGGFTKEAKYEAERSKIPITLIDLNMTVNLIIQHYDNFDIETKNLFPLAKLYWPS